MNQHSPAGRQSGMTMLVVLILLAVMLLGGMALARMSNVSTLVSGNVALKERAVQASEVGINTAYATVSAATFPETPSQAGWYYDTAQPLDTAGLPSGVNLDNGRQVTVGAYDVRYVVERMCSVSAVTDPLQQCLLRQMDIEPSCKGTNCPGVDQPGGKQYRITVRVSGPQGTRTIVQSLVTAN
jgi:type IV pilus assembly protein PilX